MKYPIHRRHIAGTETLIVDAPLDGTLTNSLGNQYTVAVNSGASPTWVTDGGRQVLENTQTGSSSRTLTIRESGNFLSTQNYIIEFEFNLNSLTTNQVIFTMRAGQDVTGAKLYNKGSGSFGFGTDYVGSGSTLSTTGNISLSAGTWYKIRFEVSQNAGSITINGQTISYTVTGVGAWMLLIIGALQMSNFANPIMGKIKNIKVWKL